MSNITYEYCSECTSTVKHVDGEPNCQQCNPGYNSYRMSCTQELDFSDELYDRLPDQE